MAQRVYSCNSADAQELEKLLEYDPYLDKNMSEEQLAQLKDNEDANIIFARQDYMLKDGVSVSAFMTGTDECFASSTRSLCLHILAAIMST